MVFVVYDQTTNIVQGIYAKPPTSLPTGTTLAVVNENVVSNAWTVASNPTAYTFQGGQFYVLPSHMLASALSPVTGGQARGWLTAPARPSGTGSTKTVTNTYSYSVRIYQTGASGTHIIDANGRDIALPSDPSEFTLDSQCKVYYATTVPTSWQWYGA